MHVRKYLFKCNWQINAVVGDFLKNSQRKYIRVQEIGKKRNTGSVSKDKIKYIKFKDVARIKRLYCVSSKIYLIRYKTFQTHSFFHL